MGEPAEVLTTLALRPRMHVIDRDDRNHVEHVFAARRHVGEGQYAIDWADGTSTVVGARHPFLDVTR